MRTDVFAQFPDVPDTKINVQDYLAEVEDKFVSDAYHSLSMEGYRVTRALIEHVRSGNWDAFQQVKLAVEKVLQGASPGEVFEAVHVDWYLALFGQNVATDMIKQQLGG